MTSAPWLDGREAAAKLLVLSMCVLALGMSCWIVPALLGASVRPPRSAREATTRLSVVVVLTTLVGALPAISWWCHVVMVDAATDDAVEIDALCEPHVAAEELGVTADLRTMRDDGYGLYERGAAYGMPRDGVCAPWDGTWDFTRLDTAYSGARWLWREESSHLLLAYTAALQRRGYVQASSLPAHGTLLAVCAAFGAGFGLLATSLWFPQRRRGIVENRTAWYAWVGGAAIAVAGMRVLAALAANGASSGTTGAAALGWGAPFVCVALAVAAMRRPRYTVALAALWPCTIAVILALPLWVTAYLHGGLLGVDPDAWRLPALAALALAFALIPVVARVNARIAAMPD